MMADLRSISATEKDVIVGLFKLNRRAEVIHSIGSERCNILLRLHRLGKRPRNERLWHKIVLERRADAIEEILSSLRG